MWNPTERTYQTSVNGVLATQIYQSPVNVRTSDGSWAPVGRDAEPSEDAWIHNGVGQRVAFARSALESENLATLALDSGESLGYGLADANEAEALEVGHSIVYPSLAPGVSIELEPLPTGLKETIVLDSASRHEFVFDLHLNGLTASLEEGRLLFLDSSGTPRLIVPPGWMEDSADVPAVSTDVEYDLSADGTALTVSINRQWLTHPGRVFPVRIDPTLIQYSSSGDTFVSQGVTADNSSQLFLRSGQGPSYLNRSFLRFGLSTVNGMNIHRATLGLYALGAGGNCATNSTDVLPVIETWQGSQVQSWPGPDAEEEALSASSISSNAGGGGACPPAYVESDLTRGVQHWTGGEASNFGVTLRARNESAHSNFREYGSANSWVPPVLTVYWSDPTAGGAPFEPTSLLPRGSVSTSTPTISGTYADPNGHTGSVRFILFDSGTGSWVGSVTSATVTSGTTTSVVLPALDQDRQYEWRAVATDSTGASSTLSDAVPIEYASLRLSAPLEYAEVDSSTVVTATLAPNRSASSVDFLFDGLLIATDSTAPFSVSGLDFSIAEEGIHDLRARIDGGVDDGVVSPPLGVWTGPDPEAGEAGSTPNTGDDTEWTGIPGQEGGSFDNIMPTSDIPTCVTSLYCQTDGYVTSAYPQPLFRMETAVRRTLLNSYDLTDLYVYVPRIASTTGPTETDIMYGYDESQAPGVGGYTFCDDANLPGPRCDQHYILFDGGNICGVVDCLPPVHDGDGIDWDGLRAIACHETGHAVGLTHGVNADPEQSNSASALSCMRTGGVPPWRLGNHNVGQINHVYRR